VITQASEPSEMKEFPRILFCHSATNDAWFR
jgi:hypothetical protein